MNAGPSVVVGGYSRLCSDPDLLPIQTLGKVRNTLATGSMGDSLAWTTMGLVASIGGFRIFAIKCHYGSQNKS